MAEAKTVLVLRMGDEYWLLLDDGTLQRISPEQIPDGAQVITDQVTAGHVPTGGSQSAVNLAQLFTFIGRDGRELLPESGFDTRQFLSRVERFGSAESGSKLPPLDPNAAITAVIDDRGDGYINQYEIGTVDLFGETVELRDGQYLEVLLIDASGGRLTFGTEVSGGRWSLAGQDLSSLAEGPVTLIVTARDTYGNSISASDTSVIDTLAIINDDIVFNGGTLLNAAEVGDVDLQATTDYIGAGREITLTFTDTLGVTLVATTTLNADGSYAIDDIDLSGLADGVITIDYRSSDVAGNNATQLTTIVKDTQASIQITFDGDQRYSINEIGLVTVSGTVAHVEAGQVVTITLTDGTNSATVTAVVADDGSWRSTAVDLTGFDEGTLTADATVSDIAGNIATATDDAIKDTIINIDIDTDIYSGAGLDIDQLRSGATVTLAGTTDAEAGQTLFILFRDAGSGQQQFTTTVQPDGSWSLPVTVTALAAGQAWTLTASVEDLAGNLGSDTTPTLVLPGTAILPEAALPQNPDGFPVDVAINITGYNEARFGADQSGLETLTSGSVALAVTVAPDGQSLIARAGATDILSAQINSDNTITVTLLGPVDQGALPIQVASSLLLEATQIDANDGTSETVVAQVPVVIRDVISNFAVDDNHTVTENTRLDANVFPNDVQIEAPLRLVGINYGGTIYRVEEGATTQVATNYGLIELHFDGSWSLDAASFFGSTPPPDLTFEYFALDRDGDFDSATVTVDFLIDGANPENLAALIDDDENIADDYINMFEVGAVDLSGLAQNLLDGQQLTLTLTDALGTTWPVGNTTVSAEGWSWSDFDMSALAQGTVTLTVTATDNFGNILTATDISIIDTLATINADLTADAGPVFNAAEVGNVDFTGTTAEIGVGREVELVFTDSLGATVSGTAIIAGDNSYSLDDVDLSAMADGVINVAMNSTDLPGNVANQVASFTKDTQVTLDIDTGSGLSIAQLRAGQSVVIAGTTDAEAGQTVQVTFADGLGGTQSFNATVQAGGSWSVPVTVTNPLDVSAAWTLTATVIDLAGNSASDATPTLIEPTAVTLSEQGLPSSDPSVIGVSTLRIGDYNTLLFTTAQTELATLTSLGSALTVQVAADGLSLVANRVSDGVRVLGAALNGNGTATVTLYAPVDQQPVPTDIVTGLQVIATQVDADTTTEQVLGRIAVTITDTGIFVVDDAASVVELATVGGNLFNNDNRQEGPLRVTTINVEGSDHAIAAGTSINVNTIRGVLTVASSGVWSLTAAGNLDHDATQQLTFTYDAIDVDGDVDQASVVIDILDGAAGNFPSGSRTFAEVEYGSATNVDVPFVVTAGSDHLDASTIAFADVQLGLLSGLGFASEGVALSYTLTSDNTLLTATAGNGGPTVFTLQLSALVDGSGNLNANIRFVQSLPIDHVSNDSLTFPIAMVAADIDGTEVSSSSTLIITDGANPATSSAAVAVDEDNLSPTVANGNIDVQIGSDRVTDIGFTVSGQPTLTSGGEAISYQISPDGLTLTAHTGDPLDPVFVAVISGEPTQTADSNLPYTFTLYKALDQLNAGSRLDPLPVALRYQVTDYDGDVTDGRITVNVTDGDPATGGDVAIQLSEQPTTTANWQVSGSGSVNLSVTATQDPITAVAFNLTEGAAVLASDGRQLTRGGDALVWRQVGANSWEAHGSDNQPALRVTLPADVDIQSGNAGSVPLSVAVLSAIDHLTSGGASSNNLTVNVPVVFSDSDGTNTTLNAAVSIYDGRDPILQSFEPLAVDEDDIAATTATDSGLGYGQRGSDAFAAVQVSLTTPVTSQGQAVMLAGSATSDGWWVGSNVNGEVFRLRVGLDGQTEFRLSEPLDHADGSGENTLALGFDIVGIDADGDPSNSQSLTVTVTDDVPVDIDSAQQLTEGMDRTYNMLDGGRQGADGAEIRAVTYDGVTYNFNVNGDPIVIPLIESGQQYGTATFSPDGTVRIQTNATLTGDFDQFVDAEVVDFDGDVVTNRYTLQVRDETGFIQLTPLVTPEDTPVTLTLIATPGDLDQQEVVTTISFDNAGLQGGTLTLNGTPLPVDGFGNPTLSIGAGTLLLVNPATGEVQPNGALVYTPAANISDPTHDVVFNVTMTVAIANAGIRTQSENFDFSVTPVVDAPTWSSSADFSYDMNEDGTAPALSLSADLFDTDGSEALSYRLENIDAELTMRSGGRTLGNGSVLTPAELAALTFSVAPNFAGQRGFDLVAISTETSTGASAEISQPVTINVAPVADVPTLSTVNVNRLEDVDIPISSFIVGGALTDTDGSETLSYQLTLPDGWRVVNAAGVEQGLVSPGVYRVSAADVAANLLFVRSLEDISSMTSPPAPFQIQVVAIATESAVDGIAPAVVEAQSAPRIVAVAIKGVVDQPAIDPGPSGWTFDGTTISATFAEDTRIPLDFVISTTDNDGSEVFDLAIGELPDGVILVDSNGNPVTLTVVGEFNGKPAYAVTEDQLASLFVQVPADYSGPLNFTLRQIITEPDGDSESFNLTVAITLAPVVDSANGISAASAGNEDSAIVLNLSPALADVDGSETLTNVIIQSLPAGATLLFDGNPIALPGGGLDVAALAAANGATFADFIASGRLAVRPPQDAADDLTLNASFVVTDTSSLGTSVSQTLTGTLAVEVRAVNDEDSDGWSRIEATDAVLVSSDGSPISLTGAATFIEQDIDGSETLDYIMLTVPDSTGWFVSHPNGAIDDGRGNWVIPATGMSSASVQDIAALLNGATIASDHITGPVQIVVSARLLDGSDDADMIFDSFTVDFQQPVAGDAQAVSTLQLSIIDGQEGSAIDIGSHLDSGAAGDANDVVSFRVNAADMPYGGALTGADVITQYATDGVTVVAYLFTTASLGNLQLVGMDEDFAGAMSLVVNKVSTDPSGEVVVTQEALAIEVAPVVDTAGNLAGLNMLEDTPGALAINLQGLLGDRSTGESEGLERVTSLRILAPAAGTIDDPSNLLTSDGAGGFVLSDPTRIGEIYYRPPLHQHGSFSLSLELTVTDTVAPADLTLGQTNPATQVIPRSLSIDVTAVTDAAPVIAPDQVGAEDSDIALTGLQVIDVDNDGSETLSLSISGMPADALLFWNDGGTLRQLANAGVDNSGNGTFAWSVLPAQLATLVLRPPRDFAGDIELSLNSISVEQSTQELVRVEQPFTVNVNPVADGASFASDIPDVVVNEGELITLAVNAQTLEVLSPNETIVVRVVVANSSDASATQGLVGIRSADGRLVRFQAEGANQMATLVTTAAVIATLQLVTGPNAYGHMDVDVSVGSFDSAVVGGVTVTDQSTPANMQTQSVEIDITPLPDPPTLTLSYENIVTVQGNIALGLNLQEISPAAGEVGDIAITGLPAGVTLSAGSASGSQWIVDADDVANLAITGGTTNGQNFILEIVPRSTLNGSTVSGAEQSVQISVQADGANTVTGQAGVADLLVGGTGNDTLTGDTGADTFLFRDADFVTAASDEITDFEVSENDHIDLSGITGIGGVGDGTTLSSLITLTENAGNTTMTINIGLGQTIELTGVTLDDLYGEPIGGATNADILQRMVDDQTLITGG